MYAQRIRDRRSRSLCNTCKSSRRRTAAWPCHRDDRGGGGGRCVTGRRGEGEPLSVDARGCGAPCADNPRFDGPRANTIRAVRSARVRRFTASGPARRSQCSAVAAAVWRYLGRIDLGGGDGHLARPSAADRGNATDATRVTSHVRARRDRTTRRRRDDSVRDAHSRRTTDGRRCTLMSSRAYNTRTDVISPRAGRTCETLRARRRRSAISCYGRRGFGRRRSRLAPSSRTPVGPAFHARPWNNVHVGRLRGPTVGVTRIHHSPGCSKRLRFQNDLLRPYLIFPVGTAVVFAWCLANTYQWVNAYFLTA